MKVLYISPSTIPSQSANAIHVLHQCEALSEETNLTLFAHRSIKDLNEMSEKVLNNFAIDLHKFKFISFYSNSKRSLNLKIAIHAFFHCLLKQYDLIISRNIYASFLFSIILRRSLIFETHQLEHGVLKFIQKLIMLNKKNTTLVISEKLKELLIDHHQLSLHKIVVLHDAAPAGLLIAKENKRDLLFKLYEEIDPDYELVCGYFGSLFEGRGINVVERMAEKRSSNLFLVFGGDQKIVQDKISSNLYKNLKFMGHSSHRESLEIMRLCDVLLMPYQKEVSIGVKNHDTGRWMSPIKMFEYMSSGVPIISSDLPVLREVLENGRNALLVEYDSITAWCKALDNISKDKTLAGYLGKEAYRDYQDKYTWSERGKKILDIKL